MATVTNEQVPLLVGGEWVHPATKTVHEVFNPSTGEAKKCRLPPYVWASC